jgi:hypothetical protein
MMDVTGDSVHAGWLLFYPLMAICLVYSIKSSEANFKTPFPSAKAGKPEPDTR